MKTDISAIHASGIQTQLANQLAAQSKQWGPIALRAPTEPAQRFDELNAPKGMSIKAKTSNWGPVCGHIPVDPAFARVNEAGTPRGHRRQSFVTDTLYTVQEQQSLEQLLEELGKTYEITDYEPDTGKLSFKVAERATHRNPNCQAHFCLYLSEGISNCVPETQRYVRDTQHFSQAEQTEHIAQLQTWVPEWDEQAFGKIETVLNKRYPVYQLSSTTHELPKPVLIYANDKKKPIASDWDLLWVGMPKHVLSPSMSAACSTPLNTAYPHHQSQLQASTQSLIDYLSEERSINSLAHAKLSQAITRGYNDGNLGILSPWDYFHILLGNENHQDPYGQYFFQHGPENRTPITPESLNQPCLNFVDGKIILTENENELLDLVQNRGYFQNTSPGEKFLDKNTITVHPLWLTQSDTFSSRWQEVLKTDSENTVKLPPTEGFPAKTPYNPSPSSTLPVKSHELDNTPPPATHLERFKVIHHKDFQEFKPKHHVLERLTPEQIVTLETQLRRQRAHLQAKVL